MSRFIRFMLAAFLVGSLFSVAVASVTRVKAGGAENGVFAQTTPGTTSGQPAAQKVTADPRLTVVSFLQAVELGDMDIMLNLTGAKQGKRIAAWCQKGLTAFVGHTDFWPLSTDGGRPTSISTLPSNASGEVGHTPDINTWLIQNYNNGQKACVHVDAFMRFLDPAALPSTRNICHFYIDGEFKLEAAGNEWIITSLPNYQEARNDSPWKWGSSPYNYPYPGDSLGPWRYPPGYERPR